MKSSVDRATSNVEYDVPERLPVIPLVSSVLFPGGVLSLQVGIERNVALLRNLPEDAKYLAAFCQTGGDKEDPRPSDLSKIGVLAVIVQRLPLAEDRYQLFLQGRERIERTALDETDGHYSATFRQVVAPPPESAEAAAELMSKAMSVFEKLVESDARYSDELLNILQMNMKEGPDVFADLLATFVNLELGEKQALLQTVNPMKRINTMIRHMQHELGRASVDRELQRQIKMSINRRERESYLREQLRAIQDELGDSSPSERDAEIYRSKIANLPIEEEYREQLSRELARLEILSPASSDYAVIKGHLDTVFQMPWTNTTDDRLDLDEAQRILDEKHAGLDKVKERVLEFLAVLKLKGNLRGPILCFAGPPGVGKTSLGQAIAEALGRKFVRMAVGGVTDESEIRGHRKTYVGAMPGKVIQSYIQAGVNNPLILIDEIDKIGKDYRGDPSAALLEVLDPAQNHHFVDRYLEIPFDLSRTLFVATANMLEWVPGPLRDRMEVIRLSGYTEAEKLEIARRHLLPSLLDSHGLTDEHLHLDDDAIRCIIRDYTSEAGVRNLERKLATIMRKVARKVAAGETARVDVTEKRVEEFLGLALYEHEFAEREPEIGVATGLAWTSSGGEIMFIEATRMKGNGRITTTGQLGDVMRESVQAAWSYVRARAKDLEIDPAVFGDSDLHIHFPAGAIPKDGPSAGVAIAVCIVSVLGGKPVRHDVAMTGEITLRGKVLSVGGIKEKVMAAKRAQIRKVVLPIGNRKDLTEVPDEAKDGLEFVFAERVDDVWREALIPIFVPAGDARKYDQAEYDAEHGAEPASH